MNNILSIACDLNHIKRPLYLPKKHERPHPDIWDRIAGVALMILSIFTLGVGTVFLLYTANKKVRHFEGEDEVYLGEYKSKNEKSRKTAQDVINGIDPNLKDKKSGEDEGLLIDCRKVPVNTAFDYGKVDLLSKILDSVSPTKVLKACIFDLLVDVKSVEMAEMLLSKLNYADVQKSLWAEGNYFVAKALINHSEYDEKTPIDNRGNFPLHIAGVVGLKVLLVAGVNVNCVNNQGDTPLHTCHNSDQLIFLRLYKADINAKNKEGNTPLHVCNWETVNYLIDGKPDLNALNNAGQTPYDVAVNPKIQQAIIEALAEQAAG